ncbi:protein FAM83B-like isoform X2 [Trematomus bernacchii]|uniref:protein FAM83B-like isoform X2 n=1 Tax=Trematomus bernacchii TaxID=40690 RepID=UPI00146B877C|nr:protein FAM83B-like isoform X2 [Trematomus bernacchii]
MESNLSGLSSLKEEGDLLYIQPHYKETYRLAIYALLCGGQEAYEEFLRVEQISHFLSEEEIQFILEHAELPVLEDDDSSEGKKVTDEASPSTYFPTESDEEVPDLDLGWPEVALEGAETSISLLFNPPRLNTPTIKEVVRKQIQEARLCIAIAMDVFTDVDIFKEIVTATLRGVVVYILLDQSQIRSFLNMTQRVGINIQDLKKLRVRTVPGLRYQCRSGVKFSGDLEQRFILVDCRTVLFGTYSYTWAFEKINHSMVLVITGQLVGSYDEEFRRLYGRSTVPAVLSKEMSSIQLLKEGVTLGSPNSSQLSLHQIHMRPKVMQGMRSAQDGFNNGAMTRGLSVQERLNQTHCFDMGNLVRGHSYGGELQKLNSSTRLRMGTKDLGLPVAPDKTGLNLLQNRLSQHHIRHRTRYGADQNLIPFNSETSLHRWKMDAYFNDSNGPKDDALSPMSSPYSSHTGLNEQQSQMIQLRSRDIKTRMEEMRQKRLSLQDFSNLRQSQESLRSMYQALDRPKYLSSLRSLDMRQSIPELEPIVQNGVSMEPTNHKDSEPNKEGDKREQPLSDGHRSASNYDVTTAPDKKTTPKYDWHESLSRTTSAADLEIQLNDPSLKLSHLQPSGLQHPRAMEALTEIPEEKEGSRVNSADSAAFKEANEEIGKDEKALPKQNSVKSSIPAEPKRQDQTRLNPGSVGKAAEPMRQDQTRLNPGSVGKAAEPMRQDQTRLNPGSVGKAAEPMRQDQTRLNPGSVGKAAEPMRQDQTRLNPGSVGKAAEPMRQDQTRLNPGSVGKVSNSSSSVASKERKQSISKDEQTVPKSTSTESQHADEAGSSQADKKQTQREEPTLQRMNSLRMKVHSLLNADEKKASKKEEKSLRRKESLRTQNPSGSTPPIRADHSQAAEQTTPKKGHSPSVSRSHSSLASSADTEKHKSPFQRLSPQRSSKKKPNPAGEQERGSRSTLNVEGGILARDRRDPVYSRYEYLYNPELKPLDKQSGSDNKLGKFMQRVGNLIGKNK